jgi:hypothetical protein
MKYEQIEALLNKYWEAETSLEEERLLKQYFNSADVDARHLTIAPMFKAVKEAQTEQLATLQPFMTVHSRRTQWYQWTAAASAVLLLSAAGWWWNQQKTPVQSLATQQTIVPEIKTTGPEMSPVIPETIAPKIALAAKPNINRKPKLKQDKEVALAMTEVKAALALLTSKLSKGRKEAAKNINHLEVIDILVKKKKGIDG